MLAIKYPKIFWTKPRVLDVFDPLLFLYFFTLHADQLNVVFKGYSFRLNNFIALALLGMVLLRIRNFSMDRKLILGVIWIGLSLILSCFLSNYPKRCLIFIVWYGFTFFNYILLPYLLAQCCEVKKILRMYFASFFAVGCYAMLQIALNFIGLRDPFISQTFGEQGVRASALCYEPSYYALYMTPFVMFINFDYLCGSKTDSLLKKANLKSVILINFLFVISTSTSTLFAYFIFFPLVLVYAILKKKIAILKSILKFCAVSSFLFLIALVLIPDIMKLFFLKFFTKNFFNHHSIFERWIGIYNGWTMFKEHPFFGVGLGGFPAYLYDAWIQGNSDYKFLFEEGLYILDNANPLKLFESSNVFTEILSSLGLFGMFGFCFLILCFFIKAWKSSSPIALHLAFSVLTMLLVLQFNQGILRTYVWTHLALAWSLLERKGILWS